MDRPKYRDHMIRPDCPTCNGIGYDTTNRVTKCPTCHGKGWIEDGSDTIDPADAYMDALKEHREEDR